MKNPIYIVLPHQCFASNKYFMDRRLTQLSAAEEKRQKIVLVEEPYFFYHPQKRPYKIHKLKIAFHRACMQYYKDYLEDKGFSNVTYIDYDTMLKAGDVIKALEQANVLPSAQSTKEKEEEKSLKFVEPHDSEVKEAYTQACASKKVRCEVLDDDIGFIMGHEELESFHKSNKNNKRIQHSSFFDKVKEKEDVLVNTASTDSDNQGALPADFKEKFRTTNLTKDNQKYLDEAAKYVSNHKQFKTHYGELDVITEKNDNKNGDPVTVPFSLAETAFCRDLDDLKEGTAKRTEAVSLPVTHNDARRHLRHFVRNRFEKFGDYQDAVHSDYAILYHSHLSFLLNAGLLTPHEVLREVMAQKGKVPINALEGFVRQLIGWREYMRYIYAYHEKEIKSENVFKLTRKIVDQKEWYDGTLGILPLDHEIRKIRRLGHAHHIIRLMFLLNFMVLCNVRQEDVVQWFMEMVALDAYPWVMWSNIGAMGLYSDKFMRKPYISTSNYIQRMSNYPEEIERPVKSKKNDKKNKNEESESDSEEEKEKKKNALWTTIWDDLFYHFLSSKEALIKKHAAVYTRNLAFYNRKNAAEKRRLDENAERFIRRVTRA